MHATLTTLLELTDAVQDAIGAADWQEASRIELRRRALLEQFLEHERGVDDSLAHLRDALADLQTRHNHMIGALHHHRRSLVHDVCRVDLGRRAAEAYDALRDVSESV